MTTPCPTLRALHLDVDTRCATLDAIASHMPDGPTRCAIEEAAAAARARLLVIADRATRAKMDEVRA